jgi:hypothetical protein
MTDAKIWFPPLHDPLPDELARRKHHLLNEISRERGRGWRISRPSLGLQRSRTAMIASALVVVAAGASAIVISTAHESQSRASILMPWLPGPTLQAPLGSDAQQTTLAAASGALGAPLVLPATASAQASSVGAVWKVTSSAGTMAAVTFPSAGMMVEYRRPVPYSDPSTEYQALTQSVPSSQAISLSGTPAFFIPQNSDSTGANFGVVLFVQNGTEIRVMGHSDGAALEDIAQSIIDRPS